MHLRPADRSLRSRVKRVLSLLRLSCPRRFVCGDEGEVEDWQAYMIQGWLVADVVLRWSLGQTTDL